MKRKLKDPYPKKLFMVMTFGVASSLMRGLFETLLEAEECCKEIRQSGGAPKIYRCSRISV